MFYIEDDNFLQQPQKEHIDKLMSEIDFPVYFMDHGLTGDGNGQFVHSMLKRPEGCKPEERFNSLYFDFFMSCMITFLQKHNIEINKIVRMAVNACYNNGADGPGIHKDHTFDHKQFILYLNNPEDTNTPTQIYSEDKKTLLKEIYPKLYRGACFDGLPHSFKYPKKGLRWVLIATFT